MEERREDKGRRCSQQRGTFGSKSITEPPVQMFCWPLSYDIYNFNKQGFLVFWGPSGRNKYLRKLNIVCKISVFKNIGVSGNK